MARKSARQGHGQAEDAGAKLRLAGLRPTRQRVALAGLLFGGDHRHVTAEALQDEAADAGIKVSLATIYNTLHQFTGAGMLRQVVVEAGRFYFDTNTADHQHFYCQDEGTLFDIAGESIAVAGLPQPPKGMAVDRVDIVVRLRRS